MFAFSRNLLRLSSIRNSQLISRTNSCNTRCLHLNMMKCREKAKELEDIDISMGIKSKFEPFVDENAPMILDVEEERRKHEEGLPNEQEQKIFDPFQGISPERGVTGVIDLEEVIDILRQERAKDIFVVSIPADYNYVDHMVVVTARSVRHMLAVTDFLRKVFKHKKHDKDIIPCIEGKTSKDWMAIDLGNIAVHVMSQTAREFYDFETLWAIGKDYDTHSKNIDDPLLLLLGQDALGLSHLIPKS